MKKGFTLIELLVVVLIIGVLSAIAIPMYQGAVDKSHWGIMLPGAKAIKDAEEAIKMSNGEYTSEMANLDVTMENNDLTFNLITPNNTSDPNVIRVTNSKLANVRLASYLDDSPKFAGQLHCEAKTGDERANRLCGKLLMGQELTEQDGYVGYLLDQDIDKATCDNASRTWSNKQTKCYKTEKDRCEANGISYENDFCGYKNTNYTIIAEDAKCIGDQRDQCNHTTIEQDAICQGNAYGACSYSTINEGGKCIGSIPWVACAYSTINDGGICVGQGQDGCGFSTVNAGGICIGEGGGVPYGNYTCKNVVLNGGKCIGKGGASPCVNSTINQDGICEGQSWDACRGATVNEGGTCSAQGQYTCTGITVNSGGRCIANANGTCSGTYNGSGCCEGYFCPSYAPKC